MRTSPWLVACVLSTAALGPATGQETPEEVIAGVTTAVSTTARGTPPVSPPRILQMGTDVVRH
ncbi:MAG: hypothetical protein ACOCYE_13310, partial [Pseudomonadota bacterium]